MSKELDLKNKLERALGRELLNAVWEDLVSSGLIEDYLEGTLEPGNPKESWRVLKKEAQQRTRLVIEGAQELKNGAPMPSKVPDRREQEEENLDLDSFAGPVTMEMVRAMSEFFAELAHQYPEVKKFREKVLGGRLLTSDEAHGLIASYAARAFSPEWFAKWGLPVVGHHAEIVGGYDTGRDKDEIDHRLTIQVAPPGITKRVRYAYPRGGDENTRCAVQGDERVISPPIMELPIESHGDHVYPSWLWPGSVVGKLYELSAELADTFDWPRSATDELGPARNSAAAWFVLTGDAPEVRPIEGGLESSKGKYLNPQWRIRLTVPPWVPAEEVLRAYRLLQGRIIPKGRKLPKKTTPLEVVSFVYKQDRLNGHGRPTWAALCKQWNEKHPERRFKDYRSFRTYFTRGNAVVQEFNFSLPQIKEENYPHPPSQQPSDVVVAVDESPVRVIRLDLV